MPRETLFDARPMQYERDWIDAPRSIAEALIRDLLRKSGSYTEAHRATLIADLFYGNPNPEEEE